MVATLVIVWAVLFAAGQAQGNAGTKFKQYSDTVDIHAHFIAQYENARIHHGNQGSTACVMPVRGWRPTPLRMVDGMRPRGVEAAALQAAASGIPDSPPATLPAPDPADRASSTTRLVLLGTGTPNPDPERSGPCVAVVVRDRAYLFDCGTGVVRRAAAAAREGIAALRPRNLTIVFVTHLHSDHTLGLADLILTPWVLERRVPLEVYGPPGIQAMTDHLLTAYADDIRIRLEGLEPDKHEGYKVDAHEIEPGIVYQDESVTVRSFAVEHANYEPGRALGFRVETPDRVIVISGDTTPCEAVVENCAGCDVLVHEVYSLKGFRTRSPEWQRYHAAAHTSTEELAAVASRARPKLLVLYHQLHMGTPDDELVEEVKRGYAGEVVSGRDLGVY